MRRTTLLTGRAGRAGRRGSGGAGGAGRCPSTPGGAPCRRRGQESRPWRCRGHYGCCCWYCCCCCWRPRKGMARRGRGGHTRACAGGSEDEGAARVVSGRAVRRGGHPENPAWWVCYAMIRSGRFQRGEAGIQVKCFRGNKVFFFFFFSLLLLLRHRPSFRTGMTD